MIGSIVFKVTTIKINKVTIYDDLWFDENINIFDTVNAYIIYSFFIMFIDI